LEGAVGSIESYQTQAGRRYRVLYRRPDRLQTQKRGFRTKRDAELYLAGIEVDKSRGAYIDPTKSRVTIAEWMDIWIAARPDLRATSRTRAVGIIEKFIQPELGRIPIGQFTRLQAQQWAASLPGSPQTIRKMVNVLSGALQLAVDDGRLPSNPAQRLKLPRPTKTSKRYLSHDEVGALAIAIGRRPHGRDLGYDVLLLTLAYCGLRWGELCGLRVQDLDLDHARLIVRQTVVADKGYQRIEAPKDYEHRSIPIPEFLVEMLRTQVADRVPSSPVFYGMRTKTYLRNHAFRKGWFDPASTEVGLDGLTPHELRHTAASLAESSGAHVKAVQRMLGHASAAMTLDTYADLFDDDLDTVAAALNQNALRSVVAMLMVPPQA
jgi:integrase